MSQITKHCHKCNYPLTFHEKTWEKMGGPEGRVARHLVSQETGRGGRPI